MRNIILIVFLVLLRLNSFGQNFFNANFSAETNYDQKNIKQNKIKSLYIKEFSAFINKDVAATINSKVFDSYYLEFNKNGNIVENTKYREYSDEKHLLSKIIYSYDKQMRLVKKITYDYNNSITSTKKQFYENDKLKRVEEYDEKNSLKSRIKYFYKDGNEYEIHQYPKNTDILYLKDSISETLKKFYTYKIDSVQAIQEINDSFIRASELIKYSVLVSNKKGNPISTITYNSENTKIMTVNQSYSKKGKTADFKYYKSDSILKNRRKSVWDKNNNLIEFYYLGREYLNPSKTVLTKIGYKYDNKNNVIAKFIDDKPELVYEIKYNKNNDWIFISQFNKRDDKLEYVYTREITYY